MDFYLGRNRAFAQLGQATLNGSDTNVALATGHGSRLYPVTTASGLKVRAHIIERDPLTDAVIKCEIVNITNNVSDSLIIERAVEATRATDSTNTYAATPQTFTSNAYIEEIVSVAVMKQLSDQLNTVESEALKLAGGSMTGPFNLKTGASIASAGSMDLSTLTGNSADVTGTTTIVSLGGSSLPIGSERSLTMSGILTITHNATTLIMPNAGNNVNTAAGDVFVFRHLGSGNWKCVGYALADGSSLVVTSPEANKKSYTAGTTLAAWEHVRMGVDSIAEVKVWSEYATSGDILIWYNTTNQYGGQSFTTLAGPTGKQLKSVSFIMNKVGTPTGDLTLKIYSNTGSTLIGTSSNTIAESGLSATVWTPTKVTFTFNAGVNLSNSTIYYLRIETNRANSTSNYIRVIPTNGIFTAEYSGGQMYAINSGNSWTAQATYDLNMQVNINYNEDLTRIYKTSAFYEELTDAIWVAASAGTAGNTITVDTSGVVWDQTVISGSKYFLSDTPGAISTSPGTNRVEVGTGDGTTRLRLAYMKDFRKKHFYKMYKDNSEATITKKYFHSLGRKPVRISFDTSGQNNSQKSSGFYDAEKWQQFSCYFDGSAVGASDAKALQLWTLASGQSFVITAVDEDSFTGTWTKAGTPTQAWYLFATIE